MFDVIIVGGGAAGFYAAIHIAEKNPKLSIALFERGKTVLGKVKVSGGGRCNVTHAEFNPKELVINYPRGKKELLGPFHQYAPGDVFEFFEKRSLPLKIEKDGRVFPESDSSQTIIDCFVGEAKRLGINVLKNSSVKFFQFLEDVKKWQVTTQNKHYQAETLLMTTGSNPKIWKQLEVLGHNIIEPIPSLFTFNTNDVRLKNNQGLSAMAQVSIVPKKIYTERQAKAKKIWTELGKLEAEGPVLITHWGFSGPAILKLSAWGARLLNLYGYSFKIKVNWLPERSMASFFGLLQEVKTLEPKKTIARTKVVELPNRLWQSLVQAAKIDKSLTWADCTKEKMKALAMQLTESVFEISGKSTFKEEFVTAGGIDLKEVDFKSFESKLFPNLYFAGEIINIDAITGGFNFQNAWTGAYLAAQAIIEKSTKSVH